MDNVETLIKLIFRHISAQSVIEDDIRWDAIKEEDFLCLSTAYVKNYSETEMKNMWSYYKEVFVKERKKGSGNKQNRVSDAFNVFDALFYYAGRMLIEQDNEILCRFDHLLHWRMITFEISEDILVAAYYAHKKHLNNLTKDMLTWKTVIRQNNFQIKKIMEKGIYENHFHLYGSAPVFQLSWISLMNNIDNSYFIAALNAYDNKRRYVHKKYGENYKEKKLSIQYLQAALIRLFLFSIYSGKRIEIGYYNIRYEDAADEFFLTKELGYTKNNEEINIDYDNIMRTFAEGKNSDYLKAEIFGLTAMQLTERVLDISGTELSEKNKRELNSILRHMFGSRKFRIEDFKNILHKSFSMERFVIMLWKIAGTVSLKDLERYMSMDFYQQKWHEITLANVKKILASDIMLLNSVTDIQNIIESLKDNSFVDYALREVDKLPGRGLKEYEVFSGERWILYQALYQIYRNSNNYSDVNNLFCAYILLRENIRTELLQSNIENTGFENFHIYQDRKADLMDEEIFTKHAARLAVRQSFADGNIRSLEIRIVPRMTSEANADNIRKLNNMFGKIRKHSIYYYVMHFIKEEDKMNTDASVVECCRHYALRKKNKKIARALLNFREEYPEEAQWLIGVDAASQEIGCRPEVFAPVFRCLRAHVKTVETPWDVYILPQLRVTYHVGEDFLDVIDGLRAIDETIKFLNMECGDRLGHAIALGINVEEWYAGKNNRILISKQDYLDNLAWFYHCLIRFNIQCPDTLKDEIMKNFAAMFSEVYAGYVDYNEVDYIRNRAKKLNIEGSKRMQSYNYDFDIFAYYQAWQLRGDDPSLYLYGYYDENLPFEDFMKDYLRNDNYHDAARARDNPVAWYLYYCYHYNRNIKLEGQKEIEVPLTPVYIQGVKLVQKALQKYVASCGIGIETNPSSNYLISTFKRYDKHPILNFYNKGLTFDPDQLKDCPQISVSINTDDLGVFSTSLENEYALMAKCLEKVRDANGEAVYNQSMIYEWINNVRRMGKDQAFLTKKDLKKYNIMNYPSDGE